MIRGRSGEEDRAMTQKTMDERVTYERPIWAEKSSIGIGLIIFALGASLWLLLQMDLLSESVANLVEGPKDQLGRGHFWLAMAIMGFGIAALSYLDMRALRLGTARARKQAHIAKLVAGAAGVLFCVAVSALMLALLGLMISDWLSGIRGFPFFAANYFAHIPIIFVIFLAITWIERPARTAAGMIVALIALSGLLAADIAVGGFMAWDGLQLAEERELPILIAFMHAGPNLVVALYLFLAISTVVSRLRAFSARTELSH
jgi:hypothetical protein